MPQPATFVRPLSDPNRLGLNYRLEASRFGYKGAIWDVHTHVRDLPGAAVYFDAADSYHVTRTWSMTNLENVAPLRERYGKRIEFIAVPNYGKRLDPHTFTRDWLQLIEAFRNAGSRICKFWAAPRGRDLHDALRLDSPHRVEQIKLAYDLGMMFMTHVSDPDTWFATHYSDAHKYGLKPEHYEPLERLLDQFGDRPWIAAHMGGHPEDLTHLQQLLDRHPNLYLDTSATKWMVRELSKHADAFADFCGRNPGRILFGTDIVADSDNVDYDLYASRFWALRTLIEGDYDGPSPIVDPDLPLVDPDAPPHATAWLHGAHMPPTTLQMVYHDAAKRLLEHWQMDDGM